MAHVPFEVDDLEAELTGRETLIQPNSPSEGVVVAFVFEAAAPVELLQFVGRNGAAQTDGQESNVHIRNDR